MYRNTVQVGLKFKQILINSTNQTWQILFPMGTLKQCFYINKCLIYIKYLELIIS